MNLLIKMILRIPRVVLVLIVIAQIFSDRAYSQNIVLKPSAAITPWYNFDEWIYANANWSFDSYDIANYEPFTKFYSSSLEKAPIVFINGQIYNSKWLTQDLINIPNFSIELIDSVIINSNKTITNGYYTPNGSIEIFLKHDAKRISFEKNLVNQINDAGPHLSSELRTPNVEYVSSIDRIRVDLPSFISTRILYNGSDYSRTNILAYNKETNGFLFDRTRSFKPSGEQRYQRNVERDLIMLNEFNINALQLELISSYVYNDQYYQWFPLAGIEVPAKHKKIQTSVRLSPIEKSFFQQSQITFSRASTDSLEGTIVPTYGVTETSLSHSSSFLFPFQGRDLTLSISNILFFWNDQTTGLNKTVHDANLAFEYDKSSSEKFNLIAGNYTFGMKYQRQFYTHYTFNLSSFRRDLKGNGYNSNLWNNGIGFANLDKSNHTVINNSDFVNTYSIAEISSNYGKSVSKFSWSIFSKHYWKFVNTGIDYSFNNSDLQLNSDIIYSDLDNVGFMGYNLFAHFSPFPKTFFKYSLSGHLFRYGNDQFIENSKNINRLLFSHSVQYRADENALFEVLYKYISQRDIVEFEPLESNPIFTTAHVRPIHLLNATVKIWMFDRALAMTLALRNLLNSTESYNTNGQYYNMSISVGASLALGKK